MQIHMVCLITQCSCSTSSRSTDSDEDESAAYRTHSRLILAWVESIDRVADRYESVWRDLRHVSDEVENRDGVYATMNALHWEEIRWVIKKWRLGLARIGEGDAPALEGWMKSVEKELRMLKIPQIERGLAAMREFAECNLPRSVRTLGDHWFDLLQHLPVQSHWDKA